MPQVDRDYYQQVWGFDPVADRIVLADGMSQYRADFSLPRDLSLTAAGVLLSAEVTFTPQGQVVNHIVFRRGEREARVNCTHTVIYSGTVDDALTLAQDSMLHQWITWAEQGLFDRVGTAVIAPEEHFVALKSYVGAIAEAGIENLLGGGNPPAWDGQDLGLSQPFGFNAAMRAQVVGALRAVAPLATVAILRNVFVELATTAGMTWFQSRLSLLDALYFHSLMRNFGQNYDFIWKVGLSPAFAYFLLENPAFFETLFEVAPAVQLIRCAVHWPDTPSSIIAYLAQYAPAEVWTSPAVARLEDWGDIPVQQWQQAEVFRELLRSYSKSPAGPGSIHFHYLRGLGRVMNEFRHHERTLGFRALHHFNCPATALNFFARHSDPWIRAYVPLHDAADPSLLDQLAKDPNIYVRLSVACNPHTSQETRASLACDVNLNVQRIIDQGSNGEEQ